MKTILPTAQIKAEMDLIKLMIKEKDYFEYVSKKLSIDNFECNECKYLFNLLSLFYKDEDLINEEVLVKKILEIPTLDRKIIDSIFDKDRSFQPTNINLIIDDLIKTVLLSNLLNKRKVLLSDIDNLGKKSRSDEEDLELKKLCLDLININKEINLYN